MINLILIILFLVIVSHFDTSENTESIFNDNFLNKDSGFSIIFQSAGDFVENLISNTDLNNINPNDVSTWPSGDKFWDIAKAIAIAEGYNIPNSNSQRLHNPGDLSDGADKYGFEEHSGSRITIFPTDYIGWQWLYNKVKNIYNGNSKVYNGNMTWIEIAQNYAGDWQNWVNNVTKELGVAANDVFSNYIDT